MSAFAVYWRAYGGIRALLLSPYLVLSLVFWALCKPIWFNQNAVEPLWTEWALSLLGSIIGFSLGAQAIILAFSNEKFLRLIRQGGKEKSYLMSIVSAFFHFILTQFIAIAFCVLFLAFGGPVLSAVAFAAFCSAMACGIAAAAALVDTADILNRMGALDDPDDPQV